MRLKIPPLLLTALFALGMFGLARAIPQWRWSHPWSDWAGWVLVAAGTMACLAGVWAFRRQGTTVDPRDPQKASSIVDKGVYAFTRNPMYLGFALVMLGWSLVLRHPLALAMVPAFFFYLDRFQIRPEEEALSQKFGEPFLRYQERVPRWI